MKNSVILEVTNDEYELCVNLFETTKEAAIKFNTTVGSIRCKLNRKSKTQNNTRLIRVWLNK